MTQENKELLLKDLCCRLPYEVKISVNNKIEVLEGLGILDNVAEYGSFLSCDIEEVKPYLFPMSSMTEEQKFEIRSYLNSIEGKMIGMQGRAIYLIDWLNKHHFDHRGLIPMGLANDATGLNIY